MTKRPSLMCITALFTAGAVCLSGSAHAQDNAGPSKTGFSKISFEKIKASDIPKAYPFLKEYVEMVGNPDEVKPFPAYALMAELPGASKNLKLLFMYQNTPAYCNGTEGCTLLVYADMGKGYETVMLAEMFEPLYLLTNKEKVSLVYCVSKGRAKWDLEGAAFKYVGVTKESDSPDLPACAKQR